MYPTLLIIYCVVTICIKILIADDVVIFAIGFDISSGSTLSNWIEQKTLIIAVQFEFFLKLVNVTESFLTGILLNKIIVSNFLVHPFIPDTGNIEVSGCPIQYRLTDFLPQFSFFQVANRYSILQAKLQVGLDAACHEVVE